MNRHLSTFLFLAAAGLIALGLTMLTSTSAWVRNIESPYHFLTKQSSMVLLGFVAACVAARFPLEKLRSLAPWMMACICVLLTLCFVPGIGVTIYGSSRWIQLPVIGQFQPSELAKLVIVISIAAWFARWQADVHTFARGFLLPGIIAGVPLILILLETDVGSALSISVTLMVMFICVGTRLRYIVPSAIGAVTLAFLYLKNNPNRWGRIEAWLDLENPVHQLDRGMQQWRALLALGNGGPTGVGLGNGVEKFGTLTFAHIDFIFPVIGEELGLPFTLGVIVCYVVIAIAGFGIAMQASTYFQRCMALGLTSIIVIPAIQNIAVTTALLPNDGLPLPFVSYGGMSLVFSMAAVGMLIGIHRTSPVVVNQLYPLEKNMRIAVKL